MNIKGDAIFQKGDNPKATINKNKNNQTYFGLLVITVVGGVLVYAILKLLGWV